jgi:hypothetical protein
VSENWKPSIQIWPFQDAPEEFRRLSPFRTGDEAPELVIYVPPELCALFAEDEWLMVMSPSLWFLNNRPKNAEHTPYAGDDWGEYSMHDLPSNGRVVITAGSQKQKY